MADINFADAGQTPDNTAPITGNELFFGAPSRGGLPIVYKMPFTTNGVTNPIVSFFGTIIGRNNFTVSDGSVTNIKVINDMVGINTASPDAVLTVERNGVYGTNLFALKNSSNTNTNAARAAIVHGSGGTVMNFTIDVFNDAVTASGTTKKRSVNINSDGVGGLSFSASNAAGFISFFTGGKADANETIRLFPSGNVSIGYDTYVDNGKALEVNGVVKATSFEGGYSFGNATNTKMVDALDEADPVTVASAATTDLGSILANSAFITGTATITSFGSGSFGTIRRLMFGGAMTLTHSAAISLPSGANIVTVSGDNAGFISLGGGNWKCLWYQRASGAPLYAPSFPVATLASASTVNIGASSSEFINITGGTTINAFDSIASGISRTLIFQTWCSITHSANLLLPASVSTAARPNDVITFLSLGGGVWQCTAWSRQNGTSVQSSTHDFILMNYGVI